MKRQIGGNRPGLEGTGVFLFVQELDPSNPQTVVIQVKLL